MSYPFTCPLIDLQLNEIQGIIEDHITHHRLSESYEDLCKNIFEDISKCFEIVRESNQDLRNYYEDRITTLEASIQEMEESL